MVTPMLLIQTKLKSGTNSAMSHHSGAVFNNSCLKVPVNPKSNQPYPVYEQKFINQLQNEARRFSLESNDFKMKSKSSDCGSDKETIKSYLEFFDSIPEYDDVNHLSNKEFYHKLENLKEKQRAYNEYIRNKLKFEYKNTEWIEDYKNLNIDDKKPKKRKPSIKPFCTTPILNKSPYLTKRLDDVESISSDKDLTPNPPSRRSVRIETPSEKLSPDNSPEPYNRPKSRARISSASSKCANDSKEWDDLSIIDCKFDSERTSPLETKSCPASPSKAKPTVGWKDCGITIPKPFQMTVRDEENKIVDELLDKSSKPKEEKPDLFKAHPVPIESQVPLFDKIMADQEMKNFIVREKRKAALQAQMRPFSFTRRDEEIQAITNDYKRLSKSTPSIYLEDLPLKVKKFKAKPVPKNLFSNYIYQKMHEDEFYRALQKKIRAEEMLKASSLPPSMAKRERVKPKFDVCPRSYREYLNEERNIKKSKKIPNYKSIQEKFAKELEELKNDFISTSPRPFKLKTSKRLDKKNRKNRYSSASSKSSEDRTQSSLGLQSVSRSNLAAVLRIESARKRLELDMCQKLEEARLKEEARWREKIMRKKPVWEALAYSHEEDLAMRLQLRRDEEKLRNEEHKLRMQLMLGRVNQQPTLFERQSQIKYPKTKEELISLCRHHCGGKPNSKRSLSDLSGRRFEMKDEAIQAFIDENCKSSSSGSSKENMTEVKEQCDSLSSDETDIKRD